MHRWLHDEVFTFASLNGIHSPSSFHSFSFIIPFCIHFFFKLWFFFSSFSALHCTPSTVSSTYFSPGVGCDCSHRANQEFFTIISSTHWYVAWAAATWTDHFVLRVDIAPFLFDIHSLSLFTSILTKLSLTHSMTGFYEVFVMLARLFSFSPSNSSLLCSKCTP